MLLFIYLPQQLLLTDYGGDSISQSHEVRGDSLDVHVDVAHRRCALP